MPLLNEALLAGRRGARVRVLATRAFNTAMNGLEPVVVGALAEAPPAQAAPLAGTAVVVFDRERQANGRERAFLRPAPDALPALAKWLWRRVVRQLVVVLPHARSGLPQALRAGLANLDEHAVAALGFEHVEFVRSAQTPVSVRSATWLQRLGDGLLAQMRLMVPTSQQPVRSRKVAQFVVELVRQLPHSAPGTRVAPPELLWHAAQGHDAAPVVSARLDARELPPVSAPRRRH